MSTNKPKDFIKWICTKCPDKIDVDAFYPEGCSCNATRDHAPTLCPCRGEGEWREDRIIWKEGEYP